jgi:ketosteroid isomerase-like protein
MGTDETATRTELDRAAIGELVAARAAAMKAGDADAVCAQYAPGAVKFDLAPPLRSPGEAAQNADGLRRWFAGFDGPVDYEFTQLEISVARDLAFTTSINRMGALSPGMDHPYTLWFRCTLGLCRTDGRWLIVHEHNSTPFHMDGSLRAAVDLEP